MQKTNQEIRDLIARYRLRNFEVAKELGYSPSYFSVKLRYELPDAEKKRFLAAIEEARKAAAMCC